MSTNAKVISLITLVLAALGLIPYISNSYENVANGGFEEGSIAWYMGSGTLTSTIVSTDAHTGSYCAKVGQLKQTFSVPIPTSDVVTAGFWYKAPDGGLSWTIFYTDQIAQLSVPSTTDWTYVDWMPFLTASGTGHYFGAGGAGREIEAIQFTNDKPLTVSILVDDVSIQTVAPPSPEPLTVTISPATVSTYVDQPVTFTSSVSGGTSPYSYQWYLNDVAVSDATSSTWTFTPTSAGFPYVYLKVTDAEGRTAKSNVASVTVNAREKAQPPPEYSLQVIVKDQCGNLLPAKVTIGTESKPCTNGMVSFTISPAGTITVTAEVKVKERIFSTTQQVTVSASKTITLTITRRFLYGFYVNYADGTLPDGKIIAVSNEETLEIPITSGFGEDYLLDGRYRLSFEASPAISVGEITVTNDGTFSCIINTETNTVEESTTTTETAATTPEIPWVLLPSIYIYGLLGVLAFGFILATVVRVRRPAK